MEIAVLHDVSPDTEKRYRKIFPTVLGFAQIFLAELSLLLAIATAITDTQLNLAFTIREYAIICAGWPLSTFVGIVGLLVGRKGSTKKLYGFYMISSLIAALGGVIQTVVCISEASSYCPSKPHPLLNNDCTYKEEFIPYLEVLDLTRVERELKAIQTIFWLAAFLNLSQFFFGLCVMSAFCDDHEQYKKEYVTSYEINENRVEMIDFTPESKRDGDH